MNQQEYRLDSGVAPSENNNHERVKKTFYLNVHQMQSESGNSKMSTLFSRIDQYFIEKHFERKDLMRIYKDIPLSLEKLYTDHDYVKRQHGHDV